MRSEFQKCLQQSLLTPYQELHFFTVLSSKCISAYEMFGCHCVLCAIFLLIRKFDETSIIISQNKGLDQIKVTKLLVLRKLITSNDKWMHEKKLMFKQTIQ
jgi:hypothetical protein